MCRRQKKSCDVVHCGRLASLLLLHHPTSLRHKLSQAGLLLSTNIDAHERRGMTEIAIRLTESLPGERPKHWTDRFLSPFSGRTILLDEMPYLTRYYLIGDGTGRGFELYLHHIQRKDPGRWLHNHPWRWFLSIVLFGSYQQKVRRPATEAEAKTKRVRFINLFRGQDNYHGITEIPDKGVWSLVFVPPKTKVDLLWGFWDESQECHIPDDDMQDEHNTRIARFGPKKTYN